MRRMSKTKKYVALLLASAMFLSTAVSGTAQDGSSVILYDIGGYSWLLYVDGSTLTGYLYDHGLNAWPVQGTVDGLEVFLEAWNPKVGSPYSIVSVEFGGTVKVAYGVMVGTLKEYGPTFEYSNPWWAWILIPGPPYF